jgi:hypothetical protein
VESDRCPIVDNNRPACRIDAHLWDKVGRRRYLINQNKRRYTESKLHSNKHLIYLIDPYTPNVKKPTEAFSH